jgi:nicotinate-nucleotide pyrophosphorylase (carboxylating)
MLLSMGKDFRQTIWDDRLEKDCATILRLALAEDLGAWGDCTTLALVGENVLSQAAIVARQPGVVAGLPGIKTAITLLDCRLQWSPNVEDGCPIEEGLCVGTINGPARALLLAERTMLNLLGRLSGVATLTRQYVDAVAGTKARIYDTRKTTPGWRLLEKYAVRCGGGWNHRCGLGDAVLIKDNHLALGAQGTVPIFASAKMGLSPSLCQFTPADAVHQARQFAARRGDPQLMVEIEVDTLDQLDDVLPARPDIVLLDNMTPAQLRQAVARRNAFDSTIELEASGGVNLNTVRAIAKAGVERISIGALTHSAPALDFGLDWAEA